MPKDRARHVPDDIGTEVPCNECHARFLLRAEGHNRLDGHPTKRRCYICDVCVAEQEAEAASHAAARDEERAVALAAVALLLERARVTEGGDPTACWAPPDASKARRAMRTRPDWMDDDHWARVQDVERQLVGMSRLFDRLLRELDELTTPPGVHRAAPMVTRAHLVPSHVVDADQS
jgi:hypothetical protein